MKYYLRDKSAATGAQVYAGYSGKGKTFAMWHSDLPHHIITFDKPEEAWKTAGRIEMLAPAKMVFDWEVIDEEQRSKLY